MRSNIQLVLLSCILALGAQAQDDPAPSLNIGDAAPPLRVSQWIKGQPVQGFKKGDVYVLEFWATWCRPCIAAMPHLSAVAGEYKDRVTVLGIDILEQKTTSLTKIQNFVDSMGRRMDYRVVTEDSNFMETGWLDASGERGIPKTFVVDAEGRLAWIGHPHDIDEVLSKIVGGRWDIKEALASRISKRRLEQLDEDAQYELAELKPDSAIKIIHEIVKKEPKLKYAPSVAAHTFISLLLTNPHKAFLYGKEMLAVSTFDEPLAYFIVGNINTYSDKLNLPAEIYRLGIEAYQQEIAFYPETIDIARAHRKIAEWQSKCSRSSK
jgi:thiol-disulfide isomerase/thioredoxin